MVTKLIRYIDLNGNPAELEAFFHMSKAELIEMTLSVDGGMDDRIKKIIQAQDNAEIYRIFKKLILDAYGQKTQDGKFVKDPMRTDEFETSEAFSELMMELLQTPEEGAAFLQGIVPAGLDTSIVGNGGGKGAGGFQDPRLAKKAEDAEDAIATYAKAKPELSNRVEEIRLATADNPVVLTTAEIIAMNEDELTSGLVTRRFKLK